MKSSLFFIIIILCAFSTFGQTSAAEVDAISNLLNVQKHEAVAKLVPVHGKDSVAFWKLYNEYEKETKSITSNRIRLYEATARAYVRMNPAVADSLALRYFANRVDQEERLEVYYKKIKTATNAVTAFEFYQAEIYILTQLRGAIMQQIPVYGALQAIIQKN